MAYRGSYTRFGFGLTPWVRRLLIANGVVFLLTFLVRGLWVHLAFVPSAVLIRPWTLLTYMFVHGGLWHLLFNMLALFFFGPALEAKWGSREFLKYYLICGVSAAVVSLIFAPEAAIVGASGAVLGVMLAFAMNWPDSPIYIWAIFPIKAKWLVTIIGVFALLSAVGDARDGVAHLAHLGGLVSGFVYLKLDRPGGGTSVAWLRERLPGNRMRVVSGTGGAGSGDRPQGRPQPGRRRRPVDEERILDEVDRVLDKISQEGIASLSPEERRLLDDVSRRYRSN